MQTSRSMRAAERSVRAARLPWLSSPSFRSATSWLAFLGLARLCGEYVVQGGSEALASWLRTPPPQTDLVLGVQQMLLRVVVLVGVPLLGLAIVMMGIQCAWQLRWASSWDTGRGQSPGTPGWGARMTLSLAQWIGSLLALWGCAWGGMAAWGPSTLVAPDVPIEVLAATTWRIAWNWGMLWGFALLAVSFVDVVLRAQFLKPDEDTSAAASQELRKETGGNPAIKRGRAQLHRRIAS